MSHDTGDAFSDRSLPDSYQAANLAAVGAQRGYKRLVKANLVLLLIGAAFLSVTVASEDGRRLLNLAGAACFGLGLAVSAATAAAGHDRAWLKARRQAETIKTNTWRFMVGAEPFPITLAGHTAETALLAVLQTAVRRPDGASAISAGDGCEITEAMTALRKSSLADRCRTYVASRLDEQRRWYAAKAMSSRRAAGFWSAALVCAQGATLVSALAAAWRPSFPVTGRAFFTALAGVCLGWLRTTQYRQSSAAYAEVSGALSILAERACRISTEDELNAIVQESEMTMARERDAWLARRTVS